MKETRYFFVPQAASRQELPAEEAIHAVRVLRLTAGDELFLIDGEGAFHRAVVTVATNKHCLYEILETQPQQPTWYGRIHLAIAPTKDIGRMEWLVEKATEVGFDEITFLDCRFSERRAIRADRIEKIVVAAVKQSRKAWKPVVNDLTPFRQFITAPRQGVRCICHCYEEFPKTDFFSLLQSTIPADSSSPQASFDDITVLVGPEGDFSADEVQLALDNGYESVTLGESRLRTETAGLSAVMMAQLARRRTHF